MRYQRSLCWVLHGRHSACRSRVERSHGSRGSRPLLLCHRAPSSSPHTAGAAAVPCCQRVLVVLHIIKLLFIFVVYGSAKRCCALKPCVNEGAKPLAANQPERLQARNSLQPECLPPWVTACAHHPRRTAILLYLLAEVSLIHALQVAARRMEDNQEVMAVRTAAYAQLRLSLPLCTLWDAQNDASPQQTINYVLYCLFYRQEAATSAAGVLQQEDAPYTSITGIPTCSASYCSTAATPGRLMPRVQHAREIRFDNYAYIG